jgi:hypothetical protein
MVVDKEVEDNKGFLHMMADIEVYHTLVDVGVVVWCVVLPINSSAE